MLLNSTYLYYATHDFCYPLPPSVTQVKSEETQLFCLRVMVGVIILYDHVHPVGAFAIKATIDVSVCVCMCVSVSVMVSLSLSQMKASIKLVKELLNHYSVQSTLSTRHSDSDDSG